MDRYDFLNLVLAPEGNGNYVVTLGKTTDEGKKIFFNRNARSIKEAADLAVWGSSKGMTAYYALGTFIDNEKVDAQGRVKAERKQAQAHLFKTLALDIDCGPDKPYTTQRAGAQALAQFVKATGLPKPLVISSGNGLHVYWPLDTAIKKDTWVGMSKVLFALVKEKGLAVDESKVFDPSMVLRPLDTTNFKGNHPVTPVIVRDALPTLEFAKRLKSLQPASTPEKKAKPVTMSVKSSVMEAALAGGKQDYPALIPEQIIAGCKQMARITFANGANAEEPEWYLACGMAGYTAEPEATVIEWSKGHKDFDANESIEKMNQWLSNADGPPTCSKFDKLSPGTCSKCPLFEKIGTPAKLGHPRPRELSEIPDVPSPAVEPPVPFKRTEAGVTMNLQGETPVVICSYDLFPSHITYDPTLGYEEVEWVWKKPHVGYTKLRVRTAHIFSDSNLGELISHLANHGLFIATKQNQVCIGAYMRAYVQRLQQHQATTELYGSFGWKDDYKKFVLGTVEYSRGADGEVHMKEVGVSKAVSEKALDIAFDLKGDMREWVEWTELLKHKELAIHQVVLGTAFAAPLVALTGLHGFSMSLLGPSGTGKSTMQNWMASVYGNPHRLMMKKEDTKLSFVQRFGILGNMPVAIDECTLMEPNVLADILYWATQGQDKNRATEAIANTWALPVVMSSNKSLRDRLVAISSDTEAISLRLLEFMVPENSVFNEMHDYGRRLGSFLKSNYGYVGRAYIKGLMGIGADKLRARIEAQTKKIEKEYGVKFAGKERYWALAITLISLGIELANEMGLVKFDGKAGIQAALNQTLKQRVMVSEHTPDPFDMLSEYINEHQRSKLVVYYRDAFKPMAKELPQGEVYIRMEIDQNKYSRPTGTGRLYIDRSHFQRWLTSRRYDYRSVQEAIAGAGGLVTPNKCGKTYLTRNTPLRQGQVPVLGIDLSLEQLAGMLDVDDEGMQEEGSNVVKLAK
jgi:hypothetical protein